MVADAITLTPLCKTPGVGARHADAGVRAGVDLSRAHALRACETVRSVTVRNAQAAAGSARATTLAGGLETWLAKRDPVDFGAKPARR